MSNLGYDNSDFEDDMRAEGLLMDTDDIVDDLVRIGDNLRANGISEKLELRQKLMDLRPEHMTVGRWQYFVKNALEYF